MIGGRKDRASAHSAGEAEWRDLKVLIRPTSQGASVHLYVRRHRGLALEWERRVGWLHLPGVTTESVATITGALRAAGDCLHAVAERLEDRS